MQALFLNKIKDISRDINEGVLSYVFIRWNDAMPIEKLPVFVLEDKYFDAMKNADQIATYTFIAKNYTNGEEIDWRKFKDFCNDKGISREESCNAVSTLIELGALSR